MSKKYNKGTNDIDETVEEAVEEVTEEVTEPVVEEKKEEKKVEEVKPTKEPLPEPKKTVNVAKEAKPEPIAQPAENVARSAKPKSYKAGDGIKLVNEPLFTVSTSSVPSKYISGVYYVYDEKLISGKLRIVKNRDEVHKGLDRVVGYIKP